MSHQPYPDTGAPKFPREDTFWADASAVERAGAGCQFAETEGHRRGFAVHPDDGARQLFSGSAMAAERIQVRLLRFVGWLFSCSPAYYQAYRRVVQACCNSAARRMAIDMGWVSEAMPGPTGLLWAMWQRLGPAKQT